MDNQASVAQLIEELKSSVLEVRIESVKRLGELQDESAVEPLVRAALNYEGPYYEFEEIREVLLQFPEYAVSTLIDAVKFGNMGYRGYAVQLLGYFKDKRALVPLLEVLDEDVEDLRPMIPHALAVYGNDVIEPLIERVETHQNPDVRRTAMQTLSSITSPRVASFAEKQLNNVIVQTQAVTALGNPHTVESMERRLNMIIPFLDSESASLRLSAVLALGKLGDKRSVEVLANHLDDPDETTRLNVVASLGWIGSSEAVEPLLNLLEDHSVRVSVAMALGDIGDKRAIDALLAIRENSNYTQRYQIDEALKKLGHLPINYEHEPMTNEDQEERTQQMIKTIASLLDHPDPYNRAIYIESLKKFKNEQVVEIMVNHLKVETDQTIKNTIIDVLKEIRENQNSETQKLIDTALQNFDGTSDSLQD